MGEGRCIVSVWGASTWGRFDGCYAGRAFSRLCGPSAGVGRAGTLEWLVGVKMMDRRPVEGRDAI
jgi:hypothetical protein